MTFTRTDWPNH